MAIFSKSVRRVIGINARVDGMQATLNNIQLELMSIKRRTYGGMYAAMKHLEYQMDTEAPLVPIDTQAMRNSWFILGANHASANPSIIAGYRAWYAPIVHEAFHVQNWTRPRSGPKWLQIHFARNIQEMKLIVAASARVGNKAAPVAGYGGLSSTATFTNIGQRTNERNVEFTIDTFTNIGQRTNERNVEF
jgi:hypothetical protein